MTSNSLPVGTRVRILNFRTGMVGTIARHEEDGYWFYAHEVERVTRKHARPYDPETERQRLERFDTCGFLNKHFDGLDSTRNAYYAQNYVTVDQRLAALDAEQAAR